VGRFLRAVVLMAAVGLTVAACGSSGSSSSVASGSAEAAPNKTTKLVIGYGAPVAEQLLPAFAQQEGIFRKFGLDVSIQQLHNATVVIPGLRSGSINFDVMSSPQPEEGPPRA
jgi:NitT/TauT family transport system substrate-binding protein